jgi:hypothetical protein
VTLLAGCLRDVHDVECQLLLFRTDAGNCFLRASSNSRTSAAVAEFLVSMICRILGVLASQVAASSMKSIFIALRYNAGGGIWLFCWKSYSSWVSQRPAGDFPSYFPALSNFGRRIAKEGVGKAELDMVADCFGAWDCKSSGRRDVEILSRRLKKWAIESMEILTHTRYHCCLLVTAVESLIVSMVAACYHQLLPGQLLCNHSLDLASDNDKQFLKTHAYLSSYLAQQETNRWAV